MTNTNIQAKSPKKKSLRKILLTVLLLLAAALAGGVYYAGNFLVTYAIGRSGDGANRGDAALEVELPPDGIERTIAENGQIARELNEKFMTEHPETAVSITGASGLKLNAGYFDQAESHDWAITIHGYRGNHAHVGTMIRNYFEHGYNVLAPDLEGCGNSEGDFIGMGWPDRLDILAWIDWIVAKDPQAKIVVHGISMGAATTMMTSGEATPDNVIAFVEDCGYTSVYDIFASELKLRFGLPEFPLMNAASMIADRKAGYNFTEASSLDQVRKCEKPMLFIHGTADNFIDFGMMGILYKAKPGDNKKQIPVEGAGHGQAMSALGDQYWEYVFDFLSEVQ